MLGRVAWIADIDINVRMAIPSRSHLEPFSLLIHTIPRVPLSSLLIMPSKKEAQSALWTLEKYLRPYGESRSFRRLYYLIREVSEQDATQTTTEQDQDVTAPTSANTEASSDEAMAAFETLQEYLKPLGSRGQLYDVKPAIRRATAYRTVAEAASKERAATHKAILRLESLKNTADHGEYYAKNIREDLAGAWSRGEHRPKGRVCKPGETISSAERNAAQNAATGVTIQGGIDDFAGCLSIIERLEGDFADPVDAKTAERMYDAYDDVSDSFDGTHYFHHNSNMN